MSDLTLRTAVVSADQPFRATVAELLRLHSEMAAVVVDLAMPAAALNPATIDRIQAESPEVVLVDLQGDPAGAIRNVRLLGDVGPRRTVIGTGPALAPELLLEGMKAGITEYLPGPINAHDLADALRRAARRLGRGATAGSSGAPGRVVTFVGAKGGTGVTTAAVNAALFLHRPEQRTLLLDLSLEGGAVAVAMGLKPRYSLVDLLENFHRVDESLVSSLVVKHDSGIHVMCAPLLPESVPSVSSEQARAAIRLLRRHYDLVVIDVGRPYSEHGRAAVEAADAVVLMLVPDVLAIHGAKRLLPLLRTGIETRSGRLHIVLNAVDGADEVQKKDVEEALDVSDVFCLRSDDATVLSSINLGKPVALNGGRSRYAKDMQQLCAGVFGEAPQQAATGISRLLRGLGRREQRGAAK